MSRSPEPPAVDGLIERVQPVVDAVVRRVLGTNDPEHEDLVQSSIENVLATIDEGKFRGECPVRGWAAAIARNVAIDALRARSRDRRMFTYEEGDDGEADIPTAADGPERLAEVRGQIREMAGALSRLDPAKAKVVYLHDVLGYELSEVAAMIGTSVAAAQSRLVRGRREIVNCMRRREVEGHS